jgi:hypothetical protein
MVGTYTLANFHFASDGSGGTLITDPATNGSDTINSGTTVELAGASTADILFASSSGDTNAVVLDNSTSFTGQKTGFVDDGLIDLRDFNFATAKETNAAGKLTVSEGVHVANIHFNGSYEFENFILSSDGRGDTLVVDPPLARGILVTLSPSADAVDFVTHRGDSHASDNDSSHEKQDVDAYSIQDVNSSGRGLNHFDNSIFSQPSTLVTSNGLDASTQTASTALTLRGVVHANNDQFIFTHADSSGIDPSVHASPTPDGGPLASESHNLVGLVGDIPAGLTNGDAFVFDFGPQGNGIVTGFHQGQNVVNSPASGLTQPQMHAIIAAVTPDENTLILSHTETSMFEAANVSPLSALKHFIFTHH